MHPNWVICIDWELLLREYAIFAYFDAVQVEKREIRMLDPLQLRLSSLC